jgi:hypothetical protein
MPTGASLHIGLNSVDPKHYGGWSGPLAACEADAEDMAFIAKAKGFQTSTTLLTTAATRKAVLDNLQAYADKLVAGDVLFLTYSGHGGQVPDDNGDEPDLEDETWCLYDGQLIDDELYAMFGHFKSGVRIIVLSDSCHSGTVTRLALNGFPPPPPILIDGVRPAIRAMPPALASRVYRQNRVMYDDLQKKIPKNALDQVKASVLLISGCQDNQLSSDGTFNGLFTGTLLKVWKKGDFKGSYRAFHEAIVRRMPSDQTPNFFATGIPNPAFEKQSPFKV